MKTKQKKFLSVFISMLMVFMCMTSTGIQAISQKMTFKLNKLDVSAGQDIQLDVIVANAVSVTEINNLTINIPEGFTVTGMSETSPAFNGTVSYSLNGNYLNFSIASNGTLSNNNVATSIYMHVDENCEQKNHMFQWTTNAVSCTLANGSSYTPQFTFGIITVGEGGNTQTTATSAITTTTTTTTETTTTTTVTKHTYSVHFVDEETNQAVSGVKYSIVSYDFARDPAQPVQTSGEKSESFEFISDTAYVELSTRDNAIPDGYYIPDGSTRWELSAENPDLTVYLRKAETTTTTTTTETSTTTTTETTTTIVTKHTYSVRFVDEETNQAVSGVKYNIRSYYVYDPVQVVQTSGENPKSFEFISDTAYVSLTTVETPIPDGYYIPDGSTRWELSAENPDLTVYLRKSETTTTTTTETTTTTTTTAPYFESIDLKIESLPDKTIYQIGEELNLSGIQYKITGKMSNGMNWGTNKQPEIDTSEFDNTKAGTYKIYVSIDYEGLYDETFFEVTVTDNSENLNLGDVNNDGHVDAIDASIVSIEYALLSTSGTGQFTAEQNTIADLNKDGQINAVDATFIAMYYAYLSTGDQSEPKDSIDIWLENINNTATMADNISVNDYPVYKIQSYENNSIKNLGDVNNDGLVDAIDASIVSIEYTLLSTSGT